jgi:hypothetical protein
MNKMIKIQTYCDHVTAENVKNFLNVHGIEAVLSADDAGGVRPELTLSRGVKLWVREEDVNAVRELLSGAEKESRESPDPENHEESSAARPKGILSQLRRWFRGE